MEISAIKVYDCSGCKRKPKIVSFGGEDGFFGCYGYTLPSHNNVRRNADKPKKDDTYIKDVYVPDAYGRAQVNIYAYSPKDNDYVKYETYTVDINRKGL